MSHRLALVGVLALSFALGSRASAQAEDASWIRYPAISPDGSRVVFSSRGDLWAVAAAGGRAERLTSHDAREWMPRWSPDGELVAFASDRHGSTDVFVMSASGGPATRLTWHSARDEPSAFTRDGTAVLFSSARLDAPQARLPSTHLGELYSVPVAGGRPVQLLTTPAVNSVPSPDGRFLAYEDAEARENRWRKHERSSQTHDLWLHDRQAGTHRPLTSFDGEDRSPAWTDGGASLHFLSSREGVMNVFRLDLGDGSVRRISRHATHPARFLSAADDGTLAWSHHGELWTAAPGREPRRVPVDLVADERRNVVERRVERDGATEMALSPDENEIAFVVRGEIFVTSVEHGTTRRITETVEQERSVSFGPDGRSLIYASERGGSWNLYRTTLTRADERCFFASTALQEELLLHEEGAEVFQPLPSPDGKQVAFLRNRDEIAVLDLARRRTRTLVPAEREYSYSDGDIRFGWSPDGRFLTFTYLAGKRWIDNVGAVLVETGEIRNLTQSGYAEGDPQWSRDGTAISFVSNRRGRRAHGSWGSDDDVFVLHLTQEAWTRSRLSVEDLELLEGEDDDEDEARPRRARGRREKAAAVAPVRIEDQGLERRLVRATLHSAPISSHALSPDGETLVYFAQVDDRWDLWLAGLRDRKSQPLLELGDEGPGEVIFAADGESVFLLRAEGTLARVELGDLAKVGDEREGAGDLQDIGFQAELVVDAAAEREHLFEHVWRQVREKFYVADLHGVDWDAMKLAYGAKVAAVENDLDFAELLSELLGELNASHTGCYARNPRDEGEDRTSALGALFDVAHAGRGLLVSEVLEGGPLDQAGSKIGPGTLIVSIDGVELGPEVPPARLLNRKAGERVLLKLSAGRKTWEEVVRPVSLGDEEELLYQRHLAWCRREVERLSGGRVGYVHVRGMDDESFRHVYQETLGRNGDKEALLVDTRWNGGGWLHDQLVTFLQGTDYLDFVPRGKVLGSEPFDRWTRPVAVLVGEANYSDAHMFPFAFQHLGLGKVIGTPVAGTGTAVWWEPLMNPQLVFGIPQVGMRVIPDGGFLENRELEPDILVEQDPALRAAGRDNQLEAGVTALLAELPAP